MMKFSQLCAVVGGTASGGCDDFEVGGICCDTRKLCPGDVFFAVSGVADDGTKFINQALESGASAIVSEKEHGSYPQIIVSDIRKAMANAACAFYGNPSNSMNVVGITGTNGKTTIAYILRHLLNCCGRPCGMLGTVEYDLLSQSNPSPLTTPGSFDFQNYLSQVRDNGGKSCVVEVSSHALTQQRVAGTKFAVAVFTNLTQDHLDYHGDLDSYARAKGGLFSMLDCDSCAVVNADDPYCATIIDECPANIITYGRSAGCDVRILEASSDAHGSNIKLDLLGDILEFHSPLCGEFNIYNSVAALAAVTQLDVGLKKAAGFFDNFNGVPGRLERFVSPLGVAAFVDYAHTPDALRKALLAVKPLCGNKLRVVFGCGGDRDAGKRPLMGQAACELADVVYVTSDNPRTEDPEKIINDILAGLGGSDNYLVEPDRRAAIERAVREAEPGDILLVAGKGHEDYQVIGTARTHFDDREIIRRLFAGKPEGE